MDDTPLSRGERFLCIFCIAIGFAIGAASIDILTDGRLSRTFVRTRLADQAESYLMDVAPRAGH